MHPVALNKFFQCKFLGDSNFLMRTAKNCSPS